MTLLILAAALYLSTRYQSPAVVDYARVVLFAASMWLIVARWRSAPAVAGLWCAFAALGAASSLWSWWPEITRNQALVLLAACAAYLAGASGAIGERAILALTVAAPLGMAVTGDPRGFFGCANTAATVCLIGFCLSLRFFAPYVLLSALFLAGVWVTGSRASWAILCAVVVGSLLKSTRQVWYKPMAIPAILAGSIVLPGLTDTVDRWSWWSPYLWRFEMVPWVGAGLYGMYPMLAHNDYLQVQGDLGIAGLALFLPLLAVMLWRMRGGPVLPVAAACAVLLHATVDFPLMVPFTLTLFAATAGLASRT